ncbi:DUF4097 family beta strand repeat-containing protein [Williamwhitmania taraxaci]|uniref:Adhesin n=1 Tax=Williamwhitmania taraxaci TaxID=1640674 RepID=A0A1G6GNE7_9BACT|nr:hypothetical protein [Williamwhitmania taraxaci]SDB83511.1 hypothetical protein SAMN05216323_100297 [Williamwhitmania taraxaci]
MKANFSKLGYFILLTVIALSASTTSFGKPNEKYTKTVSKSFAATPQTYLRLENKFGTVAITNWDKPEISIEVSIEVQTNSKQEAETTLNGITIRLNQQQDTIIATTIFDEKSDKIKGIFNLGQNSKEFSVNYTIKLPKETNIIVSQKFGDVNVDEITGYAAINVKYGNIRIRSLSRGNVQPLNNIVLGYAEGNIEHLGWCSIDLKFSKLNINNGKAAVLVSKHSNVEVENISSLVVKGKFDTYRIGNIKNLVAESSYTEFKVKTLSGKLAVEGKFGGIRIDQLANTFEEVRIDLEHAGVRLGIAPDISYKIDATSNFGSINISDDSKLSKVTKNTSSHTYGNVGNNPKGTINIVTKFGDIDIE